MVFSFFGGIWKAENAFIISGEKKNVQEIIEATKFHSCRWNKAMKDFHILFISGS